MNPFHRAPPLSEATKRRIVSAYRAGLTMKDMQARFRIRPKTIIDICVEAGLPRRDSSHRGDYLGAA